MTMTNKQDASMQVSTKLGRSQKEFVVEFRGFNQTDACYATAVQTATAKVLIDWVMFSQRSMCRDDTFSK